MCNIIENFSDSLDEIMLRRGIDNVQLGKALNVDPAIVRRWRNNSVDVRLKTLNKLADYFECSVEYLCRREFEYKVLKSQTCTKFGENLIRVMGELNVKPCQLFADAKISSSSYYYWLRGGEPCFTRLVALAEYLGVSLDRLTGRQVY